MIGLFADLVVAALRVFARATRPASPATPPTAVVDAEPAGADACQRGCSGPGGHPQRRTSELLYDAAVWVSVDYPEAGGDFANELRDRAIHFAIRGE